MTNFETGTRNTMMWRVPWASATGGHTDQIVEMLDVYPCADPSQDSQAPFALDGEGSTQSSRDLRIAGDRVARTLVELAGLPTVASCNGMDPVTGS